MELAARLELLRAQGHQLHSSLSDEDWAHCARALLDEYFSDLRFEPQDFLLSHLQEDILPGATFPSLGFSHHPMTLLATPSFNLDIYFWLPSDTLPHDHGFHGAFMPIYGDYAQTLYTFKEERDLGEGVMAGQLVRGETALLANNQAHAILHAPKFIHAVLHESFCVTLVLRSKNSGEVLSDYSPRFRIKNDLLASQRAEALSQRLQLLAHLGHKTPLEEVSSGTLVRWLMSEEGGPQWMEFVRLEARSRGLI